jgi:hypothetical protein
MKHFVTDRNDEVHGPYTLEEISNLLASGDVEATALACEEGSETWQPLASILPPTPPPSKKAPRGTPEEAPPAAPPQTASATSPEATPSEPPQPAPATMKEAAAVTPSQASAAPIPKSRVNTVLVVCIVVGVGLLFFAAYYFGRRL